MSSLRLAASLSLVCAACASGSGSSDDDPVDARRIDSGVIDTADVDTPPPIDATPIDTAQIDAAIDGAQPIDAAIDAIAPIDAAIDAPLPIDAATDAAPCTPGTTQLLVNANLDGTPIGTAWTQVLIDPLYPLITTDTLPGLVPDTAPNHAWMGGFEDTGAGASDSMEQTVVVPAGTTQLVLRGRRHTVTNEAAGTTVYDSSTVSLVTPSGTLIENALTLSNVTTTTAYVSWSKTFTLPHAGETVKVRFASTNDLSLPTNFFYDSLALDATVTCP